MGARVRFFRLGQRHQTLPDTAVLVPFCARCAVVQSRLPLLKFLVLVIVLGVGALTSAHLLFTQPIDSSTVRTALIVWFLFGIPAAVFWYVFGRVIRAVSDTPNTVTFFFRNRQYGLEFLHLNEQNIVEQKRMSAALLKR